MEYRLWMKQAWTIAKIELRRAFFSKRASWVYALALFPALILFGHSLHLKFKRINLGPATTSAALIDGIAAGESADAVLNRLGKPNYDYPIVMPVFSAMQTGVTQHKIDPIFEARYVRLDIIAPALRRNEGNARIYEFEVYGEAGKNLALHKPATGSAPCSPDQGPEKAVNGSVSGGFQDRFCTNANPKFLQVDLGQIYPISKIVIKHASAGGEPSNLNTNFFSIQASKDNNSFTPIVTPTGPRMAPEFIQKRNMTYFDGKREATLEFVNGKLANKYINPLFNFEEDRQIYAGVFQFFYLRLAIFFGCLGIFMNLFRGEMMDKTLHFWFLAPARREVLLVGKYGAGLIASSIIFAFGAMLSFFIMLWPHSSAEVQAYWQSAGLSHAFWYLTASVLGCIGYGSVFVAAGLLLRNPIIPAALLLAWESINGFLPALLQKLSVLYYLQSLCPVPPPTDNDMPALLKLLLAPAAPASHAGAIIGLLVVTALVLVIASFAIRRMQISYGADS